MGELQRIRVGDWAVSPAQNLLQRDGQSVRLEPRVMDLLVYLADHSGEVVSTDELISSVWQGRVVGEGTVYQRINQLRQALGDSTQEARFIETIPKRGYRLVASVATLQQTSSEEPLKDAAKQVRGRKLDFAIIGVLVLTVTFLLVRLQLDNQVSVLPNSVAVLPFENMSVDPEEAFYASGIHEEILNQLVKLSALNVIARTSMQQYANTEKSIPEIASELNVETVMEGSVRYSGGRIRITTQLNDGVTGADLWSETYTRDFDDIFAIESDVAMNVAKALEAEFSLAEQERIEQIPTDSPAAYALYLRARSVFDSRVFRIDDLDQAIALDPEFALAYASKAYWYAELVEGAYVGPAEAAALMPVARENAEQALALDPTIGIAHSALANLHNVAGDFAEAQAAYERALELSPNDPQVMALYSRFMRYTGEYGDAIRLSERSVELDPNDWFANLQLAFNYWYAHDYEAAVTTFQRCVELDAALEPAHMGVAFAGISRGDYDEALRELRFAEQLVPEGLSALRLGQFAFAYSQMGRTEDAARYFSMLEELSREEPVARAVWAMAYFAIADYDEAYRRLENAVNNQRAGEQIALSELKANAYGDPVLDEPRWQELRGRIGAFN